VSYIDAGYGIALAVLSGYAVQLWWRRRRLEQLAARADIADLAEIAEVADVADVAGLPDVEVSR